MVFVARDLIVPPFHGHTTSRFCLEKRCFKNYPLEIFYDITLSCLGLHLVLCFKIRTLMTTLHFYLSYFQSLNCLRQER